MPEYVYRITESSSDHRLYTVGYYQNESSISWVPESDHGTAKEAAERVRYLNGGTETIDVTPSPRAYRLMLQLIISCTKNPYDRAWAKDELERIKHVDEWSPRQ